jgi:hypothetical protein
MLKYWVIFQHLIQSFILLRYLKKLRFQKKFRQKGTILTLNITGQTESRFLQFTLNTINKK